MSFRDNGKKALNTVLNNQKNISILEKALFEETADEDAYKCAVYQIISDLRQEKSIKNVYKAIKAGKTGWKHDAFQEMADRIAEQNDFIENPFEIEEGIHTCRECGSQRVFSYGKQTRSSDEGTTVFCECVACHTKWIESG